MQRELSQTKPTNINTKLQPFGLSFPTESLLESVLLIIKHMKTLALVF